MFIGRKSKSEQESEGESQRMREREKERKDVLAKMEKDRKGIETTYGKRRPPSVLRI